jgi:hypothetical protein
MSEPIRAKVLRETDAWFRWERLTLEVSSVDRARLMWTGVHDGARRTCQLKIRWPGVSGVIVDASVSRDGIEIDRPPEWRCTVPNDPGPIPDEIEIVAVHSGRSRYPF